MPDDTVSVSTIDGLAKVYQMPYTVYCQHPYQSSMYICSKNAVHIAPLPTQEQPLRRADGRYGREECTIFPEYHSTLGNPPLYYACIPLRPNGNEDRIEWRRLQPSDWIPDAIAPSLGRLSTDIYLQLQQAISYASTLKSLETDSQDPKNARPLDELTSALVKLESLKNFVQSWQECVENVADVQRVILHLKGHHKCRQLINRLYKVDGPRNIPGPLLACRGLYTEDNYVEFVCIVLGIPCWRTVTKGTESDNLIRNAESFVYPQNLPVILSPPDYGSLPGQRSRSRSRSPGPGRRPPRSSAHLS
jgi:hypothetical protein